MFFTVYLGAVLAAMLNASSSVLQRWSTEKPAANRLFSRRFIYAIIQNRLFIFGFILQVLAFLFQAIALKNGPLIVVEPIMTCDLIFLLLLIRIKLHIHIKIRDWLAVVAIIGGLTGLFLATNPTTGNLNYHATPWIILVAVVAPIIVGLSLIIRQIRSSIVRAVLASVGAAIAFAMTAAFTKLSLNLLTHYGVVSMLTSWPIFALIISGIISLYLMVNAYGSGPLAVSQPIMEVLEPTIAVIIGILIFGNSYKSSSGTVVIGIICALILTGGIIGLGTSSTIHDAGERGL